MQTGPTAYLGGSNGHNSDWRNRIAIPMLEMTGVTYYDPTAPDSTADKTARAKADAEYLVYVIDARTRGVEDMAEVTQLILDGGRNVLFAVEFLPDNAVIDDEILLADQIASLNRDRQVLLELNDRVLNTKVAHMSTVVELIQLLIIFGRSTR